MINNKMDLMIRNSEKINDVEGFFTMAALKKCAALNLTLKEKDADAEKIIECKKLVKHKCSAFSSFRNNNLLSTSILLSLQTNPEEALDELLNIYDKLKNEFMSSQFLALAAEVIFNARHTINIDAIVKKTREAYNHMKANHCFLTGSDDVSTAAMIAVTSDDLETTFKEIEFCYKYLNSNGFWSGNNLQALSHILALAPGNPEEKCNKVIVLDKSLRSNNVALKSYSLPLLGIAQLVTTNYDELARNIVEVDNLLKEHSGFGSLSLGTSVRRMISTALVCSSYVDIFDDNLKSTMTDTTNTAIINIVTIMQIAAASAAAGAAAASASSGS